LKENVMNASVGSRSTEQEFSYLGGGLGMGPGQMDLGYDLVIEDLDEAATTLFAPTCFCPSPGVDGRPAITVHARLRGRQALVTS